jgi:DNA-directed RNA polymerase specialized sigma24 family protein
MCISDSDTYESFLLSSYRPLLTVALRMTNNNFRAAEEFVQRAIVKAFAERKRGEVAVNRRAWITTLLKNEIRATLRRDKIVRAEPIDVNVLPDNSDDADHRLELADEASHYLKLTRVYSSTVEDVVHAGIKCDWARDLMCEELQINRDTLRERLYELRQTVDDNIARDLIVHHRLGLQLWNDTLLRECFQQFVTFYAPLRQTSDDRLWEMLYIYSHGCILDCAHRYFYQSFQEDVDTLSRRAVASMCEEIVYDGTTVVPRHCVQLARRVIDCSRAITHGMKRYKDRCELATGIAPVFLSRHTGKACFINMVREARGPVRFTSDTSPAAIRSKPLSPAPDGCETLLFVFTPSN